MKNASEYRKVGSEESKVAEGQIRDLKQTVDYQTKEFTVEMMVLKYRIGEAEDENEV